MNEDSNVCNGNRDTIHKSLCRYFYPSEVCSDDLTDEFSIDENFAFT